MAFTTQQPHCPSPHNPEMAQGCQSTPDAAAVTKALTLLVVEDNELSRSLLLFRIADFFGTVIEATDGAEGLRLFSLHQPDIVLTDQVMPGLSGLELMAEIRRTGAKTPVILMTSVDDHVLLEAINQGVERFVPKPFDFNLLIRTLNGVARDIANQRLLEQHRDQEVELLRYRDAYHSMQQESALRKERHLVRHDLRDQALPGAAGVRWAINVAYAPRDIMCGDGYSVRRLSDGRQLIFVVDAMGSGMSASLTAMLTTSFFNYQVDHLQLWGNFTLRTFLERFQEYLGTVLEEEEVLSCGFFLLDLVQEEIQAAVFALPPLLLRRVDGSVLRISGENPPLGSYSREFRIGTLSLREAANLLIMTDGVSDALLKEGGSYREVLEDDFRASPTLGALQRRFRERTDQESLDDLTLLHLRRLDFASQWSWRGSPELSLAGLSRTIGDFLAALAREVPLPQSELDEVEVMLTEALSNAFEHGCLRIDHREKAGLLVTGEYDEALAARAPAPGAAITLSATLWRGAQLPLLLMEVMDNGPGLPEQALSARAEEGSVNGRGLKMMGRFCDSLFTGGPGGHLIILKTLEQGDHQCRSKKAAVTS